MAVSTTITKAEYEELERASKAEIEKQLRGLMEACAGQQYPSANYWRSLFSDIGTLLKSPRYQHANSTDEFISDLAERLNYMAVFCKHGKRTEKGA